MATVAIRVLGPVSARVGGRDVELGGPRQCALLAALTVDAGEVVSRDRIIDRLWPDRPPASAQKLVQKYVSGLRSAIGATTIETIGGGYRLAVPRRSIDAARFEDAAIDGHYDRALEADWAGAPYSGCGDLAFVVAERERLTRVRLEAQLDSFAGRLDRSDAGVVSELERLAAEHPEHERVAALLMRGLYASDRHVDALRAARRIRRHLRDEIGVDPSPELVALEQRILRHDESLRSLDPIAVDASPQPDAPATVADVSSGADEPRLVAPASTDAQPDVERGRPTEEVRSVIIVLVVDPAGEGSPDDLAAHQRLLVRDVAELAASFDVDIERSFGDEIVVVFGIPARDDDPDRARAFAASVSDVRPAARVAVVAGEAVVTVEPDVALVTGSLLDRARAIATSPTDADESKERAHAAESPSSFDGPFEGRDDEVLVIEQMWRRVVDDRRLRLIEIVGEAGIGKTRLVREMLDRLAPAPTTVASFDFPSLGDTGVLPILRRAVRAITPTPRDLEQWLASIVSADERSRLGARLRDILEPTTSSGTDGPDEWISPVEEMYEHAASRGPMIVLIEDLHWSPAEMVERLDDVVADLSEHPVLAIVTRRPHPVVGRLDGAQVTESLSLRLDPLDVSDVERLAAAVGADLDPAVRRIAVEGSGGSPLFLLQFLRMLRERPDATHPDPPDSVRRVVAMRLDQLARPLRATIQSASLIPDRVDVAAVTAISDRTGDETAAALNVLSRAGLLVRRRLDDRAPTSRYRFHHSVVADVAYSQLTRVTRIELHRRAARWFGERTDASADDVESAAWHWEQVLDLSMAEGTTIEPTDRPAAIGALENAALSAWHVDAVRSLRLLQQARHISEDDSPDRARISLRLGEVATYGGQFSTATGALAEAHRLFDRLDDPGRAGEALARQARAQWFLGQADDLDELLDAAFDRLDRAPPSPSHAHAMTIAAAQTSLRGRAADALDHVERAEPVVREHGSEQDAIRLLHARGHARFDLGDENGIDDLRESLRLSIDGGYGNLASQSYNNLAELVWPTQGPREAIALAQDGLELALGSGFLGQAAWHLAQMCELQYDIGDWDSVIGTPHADTVRTPVVEWTLAALSARVRFWRGDDAAADDLLEVIDRARSTQEGQVLVSMLAASVAASVELGDADRATRSAVELVDLVRAAPHEGLRASAEATRALCRVGDTDLARRVLPDQASTVLRRRLMWESSIGDLSAAEGRWDDAAERFRRAEVGWAEFPHPFEAAHAAWGQARSALATGDGATSDEAAQRARAGFGLVGASRCVAAIDRWIG
ncbi:MAG: BTAD domain-containing putative transcriptional regulator [Actinomycetota bacterium]